MYQHSGWLRCLEAEYDRPLIGLSTEDDGGRLTGILPLVATRGVPGLRGNPLLGARLSSLPRTPVAGPLARDASAAAALLEAALDRARERAGARLQVKRAAADLDGMVDGIAGAPWRASYVVPLPEDPDAVRFGNSRNHGRIKWAVNKAAKEGVEVRLAEDLSDVQAWYPLYLRTMREVVVPPRPLRLFEAMWRELAPRELMRLYVAEQRGRMIAGSIVLGLGAYRVLRLQRQASQRAATAAERGPPVGGDPRRVPARVRALRPRRGGVGRGGACRLQAQVGRRRGAAAPLLPPAAHPGRRRFRRGRPRGAREVDLAAAAAGCDAAGR